MNLDKSPDGMPRRLSATVTVADIDRQAWETDESVLVHPGDHYVGLRSEDNFIGRGDSWEVEAIAVDIDGEVVEGADIEIEVTAPGTDEILESCERQSEARPVTCTFSDLRSGRHQVRATTTDDEGRLAATQRSFWVSRGDTSDIETAEEDGLVLIPRNDELEVGDIAEVFVQSPYYPLRAAVDIRRDGIYERQFITFTEDDPIFRFEVAPEMIPNLSIEILGIAAGDAHHPYRFAGGGVSLNVDRAHKALQVELETPEDEIAAGAQASFSARISDGDVSVEGARVLLFGVDESVLAMGDYQLEDPLSVFFPERAPNVDDLRSRSWLLMFGDDAALDDSVDSEEGVEHRTEEIKDANKDATILGTLAADDDDHDSALVQVKRQARATEQVVEVRGEAVSTQAPQPQQGEAIEIRENLDALAFWRGDLVTDEDGRVHIDEAMPIEASAHHTASTAEFQDSYDRGRHQILYSPRRTDAVILDGLLQTGSDHPLVDPVAQGLLDSRHNGHWSTTKENAFALRALRRFIDTHEAVAPDFTARAWLGDSQVFENSFGDDEVIRQNAVIPMSQLPEGDKVSPVAFERSGEGRMYYRMGLRYAPDSVDLHPVDRGLSVERNYRAVDDPDDVVRTEEGWQLRPGAEVRVELSVTVPATRSHVALVDRLPAGLEPLNPALSMSGGEVASSPGPTTRISCYSWWHRPWYEHHELRDDGVEVYAQRLPEGLHTYSYTARATTLGKFVAMPARAEEMYAPETHGRTHTELVAISPHR